MFLAFWEHGVHDWGWFKDPPHGPKYYEQMVSQWIALRQSPPYVPSVWVSMNPNCKEKLSETNGMFQPQMVEESNKYVNERLKTEKLPYWDAAAALRNPSRCDKSADGIHVKMYVNVMMAKMLLHHLCDENMNWRGVDTILKHFI